MKRLKDEMKLQVNQVVGPLELTAGESADLHAVTKLNGHLGPTTSMASFNADAKVLGINSKMTEYVRSAIIKRC
jgi:hypothetical protein